VREEEGREPREGGVTWCSPYERTRRKGGLSPALRTSLLASPGTQARPPRPAATAGQAPLPELRARPPPMAGHAGPASPGALPNLPRGSPLEWAQDAALTQPREGSNHRAGRSGPPPAPGNRRTTRAQWLRIGQSLKSPAARPPPQALCEPANPGAPVSFARTDGGGKLVSPSAFFRVSLSHSSLARGCARPSRSGRRGFAWDLG